MATKVDADKVTAAVRAAQRKRNVEAMRTVHRSALVARGAERDGA